MRYYADLHIHSRYSVATSRNLIPEMLEYWSRLKGISLLGTGDCIHPGWLEELREKLEPAENGFYKLKDQFRLRESRELSHDNIPGEVFFVPTGEVSTIYKKDGAVRKVHSLCLFPDFDTVAAMQERLAKIGNIASDGRPILGLDSRELLAMTLETHRDSLFIPAHIWTPWFSVLGSKSGFDSIEECFGDLTPNIYALETGLSSDPAMNRTCSFLDRFILVSNSDAHSPEKLGREANLLDAGLDFVSFTNALKGKGGLSGTVEFYPQEGKYHYDGHRKCGIRWNPFETEQRRGICPVCGKEVTKGVMYRVAELSDRSADEIRNENFQSITQLPDLLAELLGHNSSSSKKVSQLYHQLVHSLGSEFHILLSAEPDELAEAGGERFARGIMRLRRGEVAIQEGYDGEFGKVRVFAAGENLDSGVCELFSDDSSARKPDHKKASSLDFDFIAFKSLRNSQLSSSRINAPALARTAGVLDNQRRAIEHDGGPCLVIAGPGTGKTRVLVERIRHLIEKKQESPDGIAALTFSNRAAHELEERLSAAGVGNVRAGTFHRFGMSVLSAHCGLFGRTQDFILIGEDERFSLISGIADDHKKARAMEGAVIRYKNHGEAGEDEKSFDAYDTLCREKNIFDLDDLIFLTVRILETRQDLAEAYRNCCRHLLVDEFQDINSIQYRMVKALAGPGWGNCFVIGDPDQAIYGFRGANPRFMEELTRDCGKLKIYTLDHSFRCPQTVLSAARQVLGKPADLSGIVSEMKIDCFKTESGRSEADWIAATIERRMGGVRHFSLDSGMADGTPDSGDTDFSDFAILCRSSFMFEPIVEALNNHGIPSQVIDNEPFYRKEPYASLIKTIESCHNSHGRDGDSECPRCGSLEQSSARYLEDKGLHYHELKKISQIIEECGGDASRFMQYTALGRGGDDYDERASAVAVMTMHASKGLEFNNVFIPGCEEGIIPFTLFGLKDDEQLSEEKRLLYVAMTRSRDFLCLSHAATRKYRSRTLTLAPSSLLDLIDPGNVRMQRREPVKGKKDDQLTLF